MNSVVLVHGGFHGGWCWDKVSPLLRQDGWTVHTPTLTGLGDRAHRDASRITLRTHVQDIVSLIEDQNLTGVVLCGHSAAGMVITGVADDVPDRVRSLIYLDAVIPSNGQSMFDIVDPAIVRADQREADESGEGWFVPAKYHSAAEFGVTDPVDAAWVDSNLTDHPIRPFSDRLALTGAVSRVSQKVYVRCTGHKNRPHLDRAALSVAGKPGWTVHRWPSAHDVMVTEPDRVRDLLSSLKPSAADQEWVRTTNPA